MQATAVPAVPPVQHAPSEYDAIDALAAPIITLHADRSAILDPRTCGTCGGNIKYILGRSMTGEIWRCLHCGAKNRTR